MESDSIRPCLKLVHGSPPPTRSRSHPGCAHIAQPHGAPSASSPARTATVPSLQPPDPQCPVPFLPQGLCMACFLCLVYSAPCHTALPDIPLPPLMSKRPRAHCTVYPFTVFPPVEALWRQVLHCVVHCYMPSTIPGTEEVQEIPVG